MKPISIESANENFEIQNPDLEKILELIEMIDGEELDGLIFNFENEEYVGISGGEGNRYYVGGYMNGSSFSLAHKNLSEEMINVVVNGDYNQYPAKNVLNKLQVRQFCEELYTSPIFSTSFEIEEQ